jgi:hypothetical protein
VLIVVPPEVECKIPRVWMHRGAGKGAVSQAAIDFCRENDIKVIYGVCPMMYLSGSGVGHRLHYAYAKWRKNLPEDA